MTQITDNSSARLQLVDALHRYTIRFPEESPIAQAMVEFAVREQGCFERSTREGHFTGSAWILHPEDNAVLLTHHRKLDKWLQLGGHADGVSNLLAVSLTEAREESGIDDFLVLDTEIFDIDIHPIPARGIDPEHLHFDVRFILRATTDVYVVSHESHDLAWIPTAEVHRVSTEPSITRMVKKTQKYYRC